MRWNGYIKLMDCVIGFEVRKYIWSLKTGQVVSELPVRLGGGRGMRRQRHEGASCSWDREIAYGKL